jgi:predicted ArsR family transcriptional regulator
MASVGSPNIGASEAKRRLLDELKRRGSASASELAAALGVTPTAVRQHLDALAEQGLVVGKESAPSGRGRPSSRWTITPAAQSYFPDAHGQLTVELISAAREALGDDAVERIIDARTQRQRREYAPLGAGSSVTSKLKRLAERRNNEGYMADISRDRAGWVLVERHCPIGMAASACPSLCRAELQLFREVLGDGVNVTREEHMIAGDPTCTYRITARDRP